MAVKKRADAGSEDSGGGVAVADPDTETVTAAEGEKELKVRKRAPRPTFELKKIGDAFPPGNKRGGGRGRGKSMEYFNAFKQVQDAADGEVYQVAQFYTKTGAQTVVREISNKKREIPGGEWEMESRTTEDGSVLLVRYVGESGANGDEAANA